MRSAAVGRRRRRKDMLVRNAGFSKGPFCRPIRAASLIEECFRRLAHRRGRLSINIETYCAHRQGGARPGRQAATRLMRVPNRRSSEFTCRAGDGQPRRDMVQVRSVRSAHDVVVTDASAAEGAQRRAPGGAATAAPRPGAPPPARPGSCRGSLPPPRRHRWRSAPSGCAR